MIIAFDMYSDKQIIYPQPSAKRKYDFHFLSNDSRWIYVGSDDEIESIKETGVCKSSIYGWRIVETKTGVVVENGVG